MPPSKAEPPPPPAAPPGSRVVALRDEIEVRTDDWSQTLTSGAQSILRVDRPGPGARAVMDTLSRGGATPKELSALVTRHDGPAGLPSHYYVMRVLGDKGLLTWSILGEDGIPLVRIVPTGRYTLRDAPIDPCRTYLLSRFAFTRRYGNLYALESSRTPVRVHLLDPAASRVVHALAEGCTLSSLAAMCPDTSPHVVSALAGVLVSADFATPVGDQGFTAEDEDRALGTWEFHDLLFHTRSRNGRHDQPVGGTYPHLGRWSPLPAAAAPPGDPPGTLPLPHPDVLASGERGPTFASVHEARRSVRQYVPEPLTLDQLGEFLYRVARVRRVAEVDLPTADGPVGLEVVERPYPSGGALHELEVHVLVANCAGAPRGLYRYDGHEHRLIPTTSRIDPKPLLAYAARSIHGAQADLQVMLVITARFARIAWKYQSVAYALVLKDVGVLFGTMYLVATEMGLSPCALGGGDADLFARAAGLDYFAESSVGEFLLGGAPAEGRATGLRQVPLLDS